jgi:hypothetical protein
MNLYAYVAGNPVNQIDPLGLESGYLYDEPGWLGSEWPKIPPPSSNWIWPYNGNLWPGYEDQDGVCSPPAQNLNNTCAQKCCEEHDKCYQKYGCNASSWSPLGFAFGPCKVCNMKAASCVAYNKINNDCDKCEE